ncbi:Uma2 family endonuclease [Actinopolymorpha alba]|uniref:Uma2 family endonuclease n=1 Tax=Actinopolymorpha alba TaxID=533267 RepID=UPI000368359F|nr:Uma2 family endonuclease [Actinopolymorpha alba]
MTAAQPLEVHLPGRALTLDDVAELAAADELHRYELDEGNLLVMPPADAEHAAIITGLLVWLVTNGHDRNRVLSTPGVKISERSSGRSPDLVLLRRSVGRTVWIDPIDVALVVEIVSEGSKKLDRMVKPSEYAQVGIAHYWRVEGGEGLSPTVHMYTLGAGEDGEPAYIGHRAVLLDELLAGRPEGVI